MAELITVKIAPLGDTIKEVLVPANSTVDYAIRFAKVNPSDYDDIHKNDGKATSLGDIVRDGDMIVLTPRVKGGSDSN